MEIRRPWAQQPDLTASRRASRGYPYCCCFCSHHNNNRCDVYAIPPCPEKLKESVKIPNKYQIRGPTDSEPNIANELYYNSRLPKKKSKASKTAHAQTTLHTSRLKTPPGLRYSRLYFQEKVAKKMLTHTSPRPTWSVAGTTRISREISHTHEKRNNSERGEA